MTVRNVLKWIFRILIFQLVLINISAAFHAHRITHYYDDDKVRNMTPSSGTVLLRTWRLMVGRKLPKSQIMGYPPFPYDTISFKTKSGIRIDTWYATSDSPKGTVILFHGLNSSKSDVITEAMAFRGMNYNIMLVDLRAHGHSGGKANSLGVDESEEVKLAYDHFRAKGETNIILWGMSLGAVVIARAVAEEDIKPEKVILEMPFNRLQDHVKARARVLGFPDEPFGFFVTFWTGLEQGYWGYSHRTSNYVKKLDCPVLLQWGANDSYVLKNETDCIFNNIHSSNKKLVVYENVGHERLLGRDEEKWITTVEEFLKM